MLRVRAVVLGALNVYSANHNDIPTSLHCAIARQHKQNCEDSFWDGNVINCHQLEVCLATATKYDFNFRPLEVVSHSSETQLQVAEKYSYLFNLIPSICKS